MINQNLLLTGDDGYNLTNSLRFRSSASAYLNRTFASAGNQKTYTLSLWVKRGILGGSTSQFFFGSGVSTTAGGFYFTATDNIEINPRVNNTNTYITTTQVFRDPSAWYHIVVAIDTTQATDSNRLKLYVNGVQVTALSAAVYPALNGDSTLNNNIAHWIGRYAEVGFPSPFDGYLAEYNFIDGQALTPFSFGTTSDLGVWQPIRYGGSYGTNGFYLKFTDTTNTTTLGYDSSPNSNNWTTNNISLTAGSTYDSMTDVPTLTSATAANYAVLNPLQTTNSATAPTNANLTSPANTGAWRRIGGSMQLPTTGKCYFEYTCDSFSTFATFSIGVFSGNIDTGNNAIGTSATEWGYDGQNGYATNNSSNISSGFTTATTGDVLQLAYDASTGSLWFGKNNTWQGASSPNPSTGTSPTYTGVYNITPVMVQNWATQSANFGQRPFAYTPPTGFVALNTFNLPTPTIGATAAELANKYFDVTLWTGDGSTSTRTFTNSGSMQPDWVWTKSRSGVWAHNIFDSVRGFANDKGLNSNLTDAEGTNRNGYVSAANSNGFSMANGTSGNQYYNENNTTYVGWQWRASNATAVTNTNGSITSTVSANTSAGFSIVTYTGTGSTGTVGHGLGVTPSMIIVKKRNAAERWCVFHTSTSNAYIYLNETFAADTTNANVRFGNNTVVVQPTSTLFTIGNSNDVNGTSGTYVAYCFAQIAGYSAFGSYTGNGSSDGTFVFTGFRPKFVLMKATSGSNNWIIYDTVRNTYNLTNLSLVPDSSAAENGVSTTTENTLDILSNGFKLRTSNALTNGSSVTYIYMAFAESPFKYANAR
jgi:hypothetical protein